MASLIITNYELRIRPKGRGYFMLRFKKISIGVVCLLVLLVSVQAYAAVEREAGKIPEKKIAAIKDELPASGKKISSVRKRRAYKNAVREGGSLLKRYSDAPNRFEVLGVMLKSQRLLLAMESTSRNRDELINICKQVANAPAEYAVIRLDADMMLMDELMTRENADFKRRAEALVEIIKRYRGTVAEVTSLKIGALIAPKIESLKLEAEIVRTMDERFADNFSLIEWRRKNVGLTRSEMVFTGEYERKDGVKIKFPFDRMGHDCLMVFWSMNKPGYKDYLAKVNEMGEKYPDQLEIYSFNVDQLSDYGESILKELGCDFNAMLLPDGRESKIYRFYARMDPIVLLFNGYGRTVLGLNVSNGLDIYPRIKQLIPDQRVSRNRSLKRLQSLFIGDFLVVGMDGSIDPALPPELKMISFKNDNVNSPRLTRSAESVPVETLKAIQACFTPGVLRFRIKSTDALANYTKAEKLCSEAIKQHPNAPDLWIVRNRRIIALLGMWNLSGEPKYFHLAADEANIAIKAKLPPAAMVVPRFCLVKHAIRQVDTVKAEALVSAMVKDMGGEDAPASVYAAASILALDAYSRDMYSLYRDKFMDDSYNGNSELCSFVSFLRNRYYQYGLLQSNYTRHEYKGRKGTRGYIVNHGDEPITDSLPKIELKKLDGSALTLPRDTEGKLTLLLFVEPPADPNSDFPVILDGKGNPTTQDLIRSTMESASKLADSHVNKEVNLVLAFLCDDAKRVESLMKKNKWNCQAAMVPDGLSNPMVQRLGILSSDRMPNIFLLRRDGTVAWHVSGFVYKDTFGYPFAALLGMKVHIEVCDTEMAYKALQQGDYKNAARIFAGPFLPALPDRFGWLPPRHHGKTLAHMGMKDWDAALVSVETAIDAEIRERHVFAKKRTVGPEWRKEAVGFKIDKPCGVIAELWTLKAIILDKLGRTKEAQAVRKRAAGPITPHTIPLSPTQNGLSIGATTSITTSPYMRFHYKLKEFRIKHYK